MAEKIQFFFLSLDLIRFQEFAVFTFLFEHTWNDTRYHEMLSNSHGEQILNPFNTPNTTLSNISSFGEKEESFSRFHVRKIHVPKMSSFFLQHQEIFSSIESKEKAAKQWHFSN